MPSDDRLVRREELRGEADAPRAREPALDPLVDATELPADELEPAPVRRRDGDDGDDGERP